MKNNTKKPNNENPKRFEKLLEDAIYETRKEIKAEYDERLKKIEKEYKDILKINKSQNMEIIQTEFIYEIANQMNYWDMKDEYYKQSAKYRIEEIYRNVYKSVDNYTKISNDKDLQKIFKDKKNKINKEFDLRIKKGE